MTRLTLKKFCKADRCAKNNFADEKSESRENCSYGFRCTLRKVKFALRSIFILPQHFKQNNRSAHGDIKRFRLA